MGVYYCEDAREIGRKLLIPQGLKIICKVKADTGEPDMGFFFFSAHMQFKNIPVAEARGIPEPCSLRSSLGSRLKLCALSSPQRNCKTLHELNIDVTQRLLRSMV